MAEELKSEGQAPAAAEKKPKSPRPEGQGDKDKGKGFHCSATSTTLGGPSSSCLRTAEECDQFVKSIDGLNVMGNKMTAAKCAPAPKAWCRYLFKGDPAKDLNQCFASDEHCRKQQGENSIGEESKQSECAERD